MSREPGTIPKTRREIRGEGGSAYRFRLLVKKSRNSRKPRLISRTRRVPLCAVAAPNRLDSRAESAAAFLLFRPRARATAHIAACARAHLLPVSRPRSPPCRRGPSAGTRTASLPTPAARGAAERAEEAEGTRRCVDVANNPRALFAFTRDERARPRPPRRRAAPFSALTPHVDHLLLALPRRRPPAGPGPMATRARSATTPPRASAARRGMTATTRACARPRRTRSIAGAAAETPRSSTRAEARTTRPTPAAGGGTRR